METGYQHLKKSVSFAAREEEEVRDSVSSDLTGANKAHLALMLYCDKYVRQRNDGNYYLFEMSMTLLGTALRVSC